MNIITLDGTWKLTWKAHNAPIPDFLRDDFVPSGWIDAPVPGDVRTALRRRGIITGYFYGKDLEAERWIDDCDWIYYRRFYVPSEYSDVQQGENFLCFDGIDTLAEVYLNGQLLGSSENMFRKLVLNPGSLLRYGKTNTLLVRILSPIKSVENKSREGLFPSDDSTRLLLRKSQMNHGWDFCGHCLSAGIWKGVSLTRRTAAFLEGVKLRTVSIDGERAELSVQAFLRRIKGQPDSGEVLQITFASEHETHTVRVPAEGEQSFTLDKPRLWWPKPYGPPHLYRVSVTLLCDDAELDSRSFAFGIRTVKLLQDKLPQGGRSFIFVINNKPLFIRGANWVPLNCLYAEITPEDYDKTFRYVLDANLSMLRVWGGGIYEPEYFFDLCDQNGIMVMQDFMLACGIFPQDAHFLESVHDEAVEIIRSLYNHPSLVLWSGDNECDEAYSWYGLKEHFRENRVNRKALAQAAGEEDPYRPFIVSSPASPFEDEEGGSEPNSPLQGDMHIYLTRFTEDDPFYYKKLLDFVPRFMSEFGFSGLPSLDTFGKFNFFRLPLDMKRDPWFARHPAFSDHGAFENIDETVYMTQFTHAQALKYWIEYMRSHKWTCGGVLYWKFNDPVAPNRPNMLFPTLMSVLDFFGQPKLAYYYTRRAYEDCILAFREEKDGALHIISCNETPRRDKGLLEIRFLGFDGTETEQISLNAELPADGCAHLYTIDSGRIAAQPPGGWYIKIIFKGENFSLVNRYLPGSIGDWLGKKIPLTRVEAHCRLQDDRLVLDLCAGGYIQDLWLSILDTAVRYSDNGFCMEKGETKQVTIFMPSAADIRDKCLRVEGANIPPLVLDLNEICSH
jgi:beta-mannosidase